MFGLVSKRKYEKLKTQWQILRKDYQRMIAVKRCFVLKYLYPDTDPILMGGKENYQKVLEEINSIEEQKKIILEKQKVEKENNEKEVALIRISNFCKLYDWSFGFSCENIDPNSIQAYGYKNDRLKDKVAFRVYASPDGHKRPLTVVFNSEATEEKYDFIALKYDIIQKITKPTLK